MHSAAPRATLTPLLCSPNFPRAQYLDIRTLMHELIVNLQMEIFALETNKKMEKQNQTKEKKDEKILLGLHDIINYFIFSTNAHASVLCQYALDSAVRNKTRLQ